MTGRYRRYGAGDDDMAREGDGEFIGMMNKVSPDKIPQGFTLELVNISCRNRRGATRPAMVTRLQLNPKMQPGATDARIYGAGTYTAPGTGDEYLLLATNRGVWLMRGDAAPTLLTTPAPLAAACELTQFGAQVLLQRGEGETPWQWDGKAAGFVAADQTPLADGTRPMPGAVYAETMDNRVVITQDPTTILFSDILDAGYYDPATSVFRAQQGEDAIVRFFPFSGNSALVFKSRSILLLDGITGTLAQAGFEEVNRSLGLAARKAVASVGADVFFLSRTGVFRISQVVESRIATAPVPVSDDIEPFFRERVNWDAIGGAVATVHEEYFLLALPIDGGTGNNALLVYNTSSNGGRGAWEGHWTFPAGGTVIDLVKLDVRGKERLVAIDGTNCWTYLLESGGMDRVNQTDLEIPVVVESRGYVLGDPAHKILPRCSITVSTWRPSYTVTARLDGANASKVLVSNRTRSRTRYYTHGKAEYNRSNINNDHPTPRREDYSVNLSVPFQLRGGIVFDQKQSATESWTIRQRARWVTLRITNAQGRCEVEATSAQGLVQDRDLKTKN